MPRTARGNATDPGRTATELCRKIWPEASLRNPSCAQSTAQTLSHGNWTGLRQLQLSRNRLWTKWASIGLLYFDRRCFKRCRPLFHPWRHFARSGWNPFRFGQADAFCPSSFRRRARAPRPSGSSQCRSRASTCASSTPRPRRAYHQVGIGQTASTR